MTFGWCWAAGRWPAAPWHASAAAPASGSPVSPAAPARLSRSSTRRRGSPGTAGRSRPSEPASAKAGGLHAGGTQVVEELDIVNPQHDFQWIGSPALAAFVWGRKGGCAAPALAMDSGRPCVRETVHGGSYASCPGIPSRQMTFPCGNGALPLYLISPPAGIGSVDLLSRINPDLVQSIPSRLLLDQATIHQGSSR